MCQKLTYLNKFMKSKTSFFNSKVFARYNYYRKSLLEMIRFYLYDCSVYLVPALISIGLTTLILRTYLPLFVLRNGSLHGLRKPREEIAFTALPKIHSHSQICKYGGSIFCLPHRPNFSDIFDLCLHWVSVVRVLHYEPNTVQLSSKNYDAFLPYKS